MLDRRGRVKIMDFGLAAVADRTRLTKSGTTLGTPAYMSPEQAELVSRIDVDTLGNIYVSGPTDSVDFPVTDGAFQTTFAGAIDAFAAKINPAGDAVVWSSYLGGSRSGGSSPRQRAEFRRQLPEFASVMGWIGRSASVYRLLVRQRNPQRIEDFCLAGVGNRQPCDAGLLIHSIFQ